MPFLHARAAPRRSTLSDITWTLLLLAAVVLGSWTAWRLAPELLAEEGWHEAAEAAVLFAAAAAHGWSTRWGRAREPGMLVRTAVGLLCLSFGLREVEIDDIGDPAVWRPVERALRGVALALWLLLLLAAVLRLRGRPLRGELFARPWSFHARVALAGVLLVASWPFDKGRVPVDPALSLLVEETLELCGYVLLLAAARVRPAAAYGVVPGEGARGRANAQVPPT